MPEESFGKKALVNYVLRTSEVLHSRGAYLGWDPEAEREIRPEFEAMCGVL